MKQRFALYNGLHHGHFATPEAVYDTPEEAADAARALVIENICNRRVEACGDPASCAVLVLPVPAFPLSVPDCLKTQETP